MNKERRKELETISSSIAELKAAVDAVAEAEQEAFDSLPENLQDSEKGERMEENVSEMEVIATELDSLMECVDEVINK